jgi:anti-sigma factor ChrR (cupin superfamily)
MATAREMIRSQIIPVSEAPWADMDAGIRMKKLWSHKETNRQALMVQIDAGTHLPMHKYVGNELVYVVEGAMQDEFGALTAGNIGYRPDGCVHTVLSPNGTRLNCYAMTGGTINGSEKR